LTSLSLTVRQISQGHAQERYFYLFDNLLLYCKRAITVRDAGVIGLFVTALLLIHFAVHGCIPLLQSLRSLTNPCRAS
jgi:hypothetical protein